MVKRYWKTFAGMAFAIIILLLLIVQNKFILVKENSISYDEKIGIIDDSLIEEPIDIYYSGMIVSDGESHGQKILDFVSKISCGEEIYYYSAERNGKIDTDAVLDALEWMKDNEVRRVNISLSTKKRDQRIANWIADNPETTIFCSYNNLLNSADYPAMYEGTIASGNNKVIQFKKEDVEYKSNRIVVYGESGMDFFKGNSFLSIISMLEH